MDKFYEDDQHDPVEITVSKILNNMFVFIKNILHSP